MEDPKAPEQLTPKPQPYHEYGAGGEVRLVNPPPDDENSQGREVGFFGSEPVLRFSQPGYLTGHLDT